MGWKGHVMIARRHVFILLALVLVTVAMSAGAFSRLPALAPIHWNWRGEADGFGSRWTISLVFPVTAAFLVALFLALPMLSPIRDASDRSRLAYGRCAVVGIVGVVLIHATILGRALGWAIDVPSSILVIAGALLAGIGNEMKNVRRNPWIGIRTPWTLASDDVWERTHRVGRRLMVAWGLTIALAGLVLPNWAAIVIVIAGAIGLTVWSMAYSYALSRQANV